MKIIFAGSGEFGVPTLQELLRAGHELSLVISQPDRPAGRGRHPAPTPISRHALDAQLPLLRTADVNHESLPPADLLLVIAFGQKIAPPLVAHARLGAMNLHGSRLPRFRGAAPINAAILAGDEVSGNSIIRLAERMDAGAILSQSSVPIGETETAGELHDRLSVDGATLMLATISRLERGEITEQQQDESLATRAAKLSRQSTHIDWTLSADAIGRQIRGMYPWPGCHVDLVDESSPRRTPVTLVRARPTGRAASPDHPAGSIQTDFSVATGLGSLEILEIQPDGKRAMPLAAFRNGHPWHDQMRLESR